MKRQSTFKKAVIFSKMKMITSEKENHFQPSKWRDFENVFMVFRLFTVEFLNHGNDPSAGSPTETLLRLLLPLDDQVWASSRPHGRSQQPV